MEQEHRAQSAADARPRNETVEQICAYLAANYQQKLSLTEVAARFYISPYYLSRLFRRVTGQSIVDYINARRIEAAQKLLETTELSIGSVAEQTGFASAAHFRRVFGRRWASGRCNTGRVENREPLTLEMPLRPSLREEAQGHSCLSGLSERRGLQLSP